MSYAFKKFKNLSEPKRDIYFKKYEVAKEKYQKQMKEFLAKNPHLKVVKTPSKKKKKSKEPTIITPFHVFRETLTNGEHLTVAQKMWRDMHPEEKCKYVKIVAGMDEDTKISKEEWKILEQEGINGVPKKPLTAYQIFFKETHKNYAGESKKLSENISVAWKGLAEEQRLIYNLKHEKAIGDYREELKKYIENLPKERQGLMYQKYRKELGSFRKRKNSNNETVLDITNGMSPSKQNRDESPVKIKLSHSFEEPDEPVKKKKKKKDQDQQDSLVKSQELLSQSSVDEASTSEKKKKKKKNQEMTPVVEEEKEATPPPKSPKKKKKNSESSQEPFKKFGESPLKIVKAVYSESETEKSSPKKKKVLKEPEFPSQTTAHYYMTHIFKGNRKVIGESYKYLSKQMKSMYYSEMKRDRLKYLEEMAEYIKTLPDDEIAAVRKKTKKMTQQQMKELAWHTDKGTDDERNHRKSSSDSDSDSS
jgi:hypothetical protein